MSFIYSNGAQFNGSSQYFTRAIASTVTNNFSMSAWFKPLALANTRYFHNGADDANGFALSMSSAGIIRGEYHFVAFINSAVTASPGTWFFVAMVRNAGTTQMYVNGVPSGGTSGSAPNTPGSYTTIGASQNAAGTPSYFNGLVDDARLYERAITAHEVSQLYYRGLDIGTPDISTTSLRVHYKLDESSGNASDSSGNSLTLTNTGTVTYVNGKIPTSGNPDSVGGIYRIQGFQ